MIFSFGTFLSKKKNKNYVTKHVLDIYYCRSHTIIFTSLQCFDQLNMPVCLLSLSLQRSDEFNIYTREAGAGGLSIAVEGPSKAEIEFQDKKDGSCNVAYRVSEPGTAAHSCLCITV